MPLDVYSPCPGGTGKKIKFCCPDQVADLQKIDRMLEGEQYEACLSHVERLAQRQPPRACLLRAKCLLLRITNRLDEAEATAATFLQHYPGNPVALAEKAILTGAKQGGRAAMPWLQRALAASAKDVPDSVWDMLAVVGQFLAMEGEFLAARAVLQWAVLLSQDDPRPAELLGRINAARDLPVWFKDERRLVPCPAGVPWAGEFNEATALARRGHWSAAEERLAALAPKAGDHPAIWRNLALVRGWLADRAGAIEALRRFAASDVPLEDAVEAEAVALFLSEDPLGDHADVLSLCYAVSDPERFDAAVVSSGRMTPIGFNPSSFTEEGEPPPLAVYMVFDRPVPRNAAEVTLQTTPRVLCQAQYYGRQTDRQARLEVHPVAARDLATVQAVLADSAQGTLGPLEKQEVVERVSQTQEILAHNWALPNNMSAEAVAALVRQHYDRAILTQWPALPLGILEGQPPQEAARDPRWRVRLLAAILLLDFWAGEGNGHFDFNRLRSQLGLPTLDPIDPEHTQVERLPVARLSRLVVEKLSDDALLKAFRRAMGLNEPAALRKLGRAMVERPSLAGREDRSSVCSLLARLEGHSDLALYYVEEGRKAAEAAEQSSAPWDLLELSIRFARREEDHVERLFGHLRTQHIREPGVASALRNWLVQIGAIGPDGMPVAPQPPPSPQQPSLVVPTQPGTKPGELWVPGDQAASEQKPKLWVPGSQ